MSEIIVSNNRNLPKISIIIPVYNVELYITECLQSVMRQTYKGEIECIIVDDCGKDRSVEIAEQLVNTYNGPIEFRILHHEHNRGLSAARNTGTDAATGDYIYYLDSDDYISDDCIEVLTQPLQEYSYDMVIGNVGTFGTQNCKMLYLTHPTGKIVCYRDILFEFYISMSLYLMSVNKLIRKNLFCTSDMSFVEGQIHEDELWTYKSCMAMSSLYVQNQETYFYRIHEKGIMGKIAQNVQKRAQSVLISADYVLAHPIEKEKEVWHQIALYYVSDYFSVAFPTQCSYKQYANLRKRLDYRLLKEYMQGKVSLSALRHRFHYILPSLLGYLYLKIRKRMKK